MTASIGDRNPVGSSGAVPVLYKIDSNAMVDAQLGVTSANGKYRASLWATNLTNACHFNYLMLAAEAFVRYAALQRTSGESESVRLASNSIRLTRPIDSTHDLELTTQQVDEEGSVQTSMTSGTANRAWAGLLPLVSAIGSRHFETALAHYLNAACGVEHVSIFRSIEGVPVPTSSMSADGTDVSERQTRTYIHAELWRDDPSMRRAMSCADAVEPLVLHLDLVRAHRSKFRDALLHRLNIHERVFICGRREGGILGLAMWQSSRTTSLDPSRDQQVLAATQAAYAMLSKHLDICGQGESLARALTSLEEIEQCVARSTLKLPRRESEVGARILFGLSTTGIALDLGLSEETVITYRRRLYTRLAVFNLRGLLQWYIVLWSKTGFMRQQ